MRIDNTDRWTADSLSPVLDYWHVTDDLRLYPLVQFGPMLLIPVILATSPAKYLRTCDIVIVLGWYVAAKVLEQADAWVYSWGGVVSGHAFKHFAAAAAGAWVLRALGGRRVAHVSNN